MAGPAFPKEIVVFKVPEESCLGTTDGEREPRPGLLLGEKADILKENQRESRQERSNDWFEGLVCYSLFFQENVSSLKGTSIRGSASLLYFSLEFSHEFLFFLFLTYFSFYLILGLVIRGYLYCSHSCELERLQTVLFLFLLTCPPFVLPLTLDSGTLFP